MGGSHPVIEVSTAHTADLDPVTLEAVRALLDLAFEGDFDDHDWDHALGGVHALGRDEGELVVHGSVVQRRILHGGRALRTGYVEAVAVHPDRRRLGHASMLMDSLERVIRGAYELGALSASGQGAPLYAARGWQRWRGPTSALTPAGVARTPGDDGSIYVLPVDSKLDLDRELTCDWREGDVW
jgi:aminoglycoside 2'-N-acetyltransferase I